MGDYLNLIECEDQGAFEEPDGTSDEDLAEYLKDEHNLAFVRDDIRCWLNEPPDEEDYELADIYGNTAQGSANRYFRDFLDSDIRDKLGVVIIEGDHPGSSYFAAELHGSIEYANATAEELKLPFRFRNA